MSDDQPGEPNREEPNRENPNQEQPWLNPPPPSAPPRQFTSNYPRAGQSFFGYVRPPGVYWDTLNTSVSMVFGNWAIYAVCSVLAFILIGITYIPVFAIMGASMTMILTNPTKAPTPVQPFLLLGPQILVQFAFAFALLCLISVGVRHAQGNAPQLDDFFIPFRRFGRACLAALMISIPQMVLQILSALVQTAIGTSPFAALGLLLVVLLAALLLYVGLFGTLLLAGTASLFTDIPPTECVKRLFVTLGWNNIMLGLLTLVGTIIGSLSVLACCVGILLGYPVMPNIIALHFLYCFPEATESASPGYRNTPYR